MGAETEDGLSQWYGMGWRGGGWVVGDVCLVCYGMRWRGDGWWGLFV